MDADFLRFYRTEWRSLSGPRFFSLAERVVAYGGVMTQRAMQEARNAPEPVVALSDLAGDDLIEVG